MPTPVSAARQYLSEEAASVLDDAVAVARRRCHAQTTSLHAVSALLSLPSSLLRDACSRARSPSCPSRIQFRALELCVGVSLDRLPCSKSSAGGASSSSEDDAPPVSNSLMAAIRRSQGNQRRQPEMYQIAQHTASSICSISSIKVELKNFVVSILDDPSVSRVLGDAGFRSTDMRLAILHPPAPPPPARYFRGAGSSGGRCPPLFLCNLTDPGFPVGGNIPLPFSRGGHGEGGVGNCDGDGNCRRIGEILVKSSGRNPLLVGICAKDALASFKECVDKGKGEGVLPSQIVGLDLICVEKEIMEFVSNGGSKEVLNSKVEELSSAVEGHSGPGVVVNFGELKVLVEDDGGSEDAVKCLVSKLSVLLELYKKKMWLIGAAANYETYRKFLDRFPSLETDWDLHPLPITSSRSSVGELYSKSSWMGSFVPFGGFFSTPSEFRSPMGLTFSRCSLCNEKYDRELSAIMRGDSCVSVADPHSSSLPSWLQKANPDVIKSHNAGREIPDENAECNAKILGLQRKWDDMCQRLHQVPKVPWPDASMASSTIPCSLGFPFVANKQRSGSGSLFSIDQLSSGLGSSVSAMVQKQPSQEQSMKAPDLGLGTFAPTSQELKKPDSHVNRGHLQHFSCSVSTERPVNEKASDRVFPSSPAGPELRCQLGDRVDQGDYKLIVQKLTEKVAWQIEACSDVGQIISCHKGGNGQCRASYVRQDTWIGFIGPDKIGKKRMAEAVAELMFGSRENLIAIDLSVQGSVNVSHSMFDTRLPDDIGVKSGRKTVVDYIAGELSKKPCSVIFLENVDKTDDLLAQRSLSRAIQTGRFPDSHGREISIVNAIFLMTWSSTGEDHLHSHVNSFVKFSEERILEALNWQMQIVIEHVAEETASRHSNSSTVALLMEKSASHKTSTNKRKQYDTDDPLRPKKQKGFLDLNLPLEEDTEETSEAEIINDTDTISDYSRAWLQDFLGQVARKVTFKPFNFDALANKLLNKMSLSLQRRLGLGFRLEVDQDVMIQILAAAWCSDGERPVDDWIEEVLGATSVEAQRRHCLHKQTLMKLVSCPGIPVEKHAPGIRLPRTINLG